MRQVSHIYSYLKTVTPIPVPNNPRLEILVIWFYQLVFAASLDVVGRWKLSKLEKQQIGLQFSLNSRFNLIAGLDPMDLVSTRLRDHLLLGSQITPPVVPFAFIDTHPGTNRAVPQNVLDGIRAKGLELVFTDTSVPLHELALTMFSAQELHMVGSAPLCLALTIGTKNPIQVYYPHWADDLTHSYPGWVTKRLE